MKKQDGFVSIIVALVIMIFITLIALGFAFVARQNQNQNQNRLLSMQAFYAAESGVNDAIKYISDYIATNGTEPPDITNCNNGAPVPGSVNTIGSSNSEVKYTCVLINQSPTTLVYDSISKDESTIVHIKTSTPVNTLTFSWQDSGSGDDFAASNSNFYLPQAKAIAGNANSPFLLTPLGKQTAEFPNHTGMLRTTIIPTTAISNADNLLNQSQTVYMYPRADVTPNNPGSVAFRTGGSSPVGLASEGVFGSGNCNTGNNNSATPEAPRYCNTKITGINSSDFYIRLKAIYKPVALTIQAKDSSNNALAMTGAQRMIDSTGKATDVLRRIQVRVPLEPAYYFPEFAIESADTICKRLMTYIGGAEVEAPENYIYDDDATAAGGEKNNKAKDAAACQLPGQGLPF